MRSSVCVSVRISRKCYTSWYDLLSGGMSRSHWVFLTSTNASLAPHYLLASALPAQQELMDAQERDMKLFCAACARAYTYLQVRLGLCIYFTVGFRFVIDRHPNRVWTRVRL
jgi:hypothetical protein